MKMKNICKDCNKEISENAVRCKSCCRKGDLNVMKILKIRKKHKEVMNKFEVKKAIGKNHWSTKENAEDVREVVEKKLKGHLVTQITKNKISKKQKGIPKSEDMKKRIKETCLIVMNTPKMKKLVSERTTETALRGEKHPNWQNGISLLPYSKEFNDTFKKAIFLRDNNCLICGKNEKLCIHHLDYNKLNSIKENCLTLCMNCHSKTNFNRKHWIQFFQSLLNERYGYTYTIVAVSGIENGTVL